MNKQINLLNEKSPMPRILLYLLILLVWPCSVLAGNTHEYKLPNGLQLIVREDHRAPVVVSQVWYKVGSSYEHNGITGISHVLEHMMFKGTKRYGPGQFSSIIAANGGQQNAFTDYDYTGYYQVLAADKLPISFELEADRMQNLLLRPEDFAKEIQVVMEEERMRLADNPQAMTYMRFMAAAHIANSYHHPVIGWLSDLQNMTVEDVRAWYQQWYGPNNAVVVVVGDVDPQQVYKLAQTYFGPLKPIKLPIVKPERELKALGERSVVVKLPAQLPMLIMGYNVPSVKTTKISWEPYALEVLSGILAAGDSSRLAVQLVRGRQIATLADASYDPYSRLSTVFLLYGIPAADHTTAQLKSAFLAQVKALQTQPITKDELERVKAQVIANNVFAKDDLQTQANQLGALAAVGLPWQLSDQYVQNIEAITPKQIQTVALKYLNPDQLTVASLIPQPLPKNYTPPVTPPGIDHVH